MELQILIVLAIISETVYSNIRMLWDANTFNWNVLGALVVSILITVGTGVDIFPALGIAMSIPFVGSVLTGILISRGANVVYDLLNKLKEILAGKTITETVVEEVAEAVVEEATEVTENK